MKKPKEYAAEILGSGYGTKLQMAEAIIEAMLEYGEAKHHEGFGDGYAAAAEEQEMAAN